MAGMTFKGYSILSSQFFYFIIPCPLLSPHSASQADYFELYLSFILLGYAVLFTNYRGSLGYGQLNLDSLPGHIGRQDVDDVMTLTNHCLTKLRVGDAKKLVVFGGSHGGFLAAHLTGQYPGR